LLAGLQDMTTSVHASLLCRKTKDLEQFRGLSSRQL